MADRLSTGKGFMTRLRRDKRGNTLAMMAIALIPMAGLAGSAVDMARLYVVKVRLQQACDAGVLAGRKFMTDSNNATLDDVAASRAQTFFSNNFRSGWMKVSSPVFTPVKTADNQVAGTASAVVPMTIMKMFAVGDTTLNVTCQARYDVPDVDVVFVLDTTGSMACTPQMTDNQCTTYVNGATKVSYSHPSGSGVPGYANSAGFYVTESKDSAGVNNSRIQALRQAVTDFYDTMANNIDSSTHVRYGFVTYSSMVNPGQAILDKSSSYMLGGAGSGGAQTWTYQSREVTGDYKIGSTSAITWNTKKQNKCSTTLTRNPAATATQPYTYDTSTQQAVVTTEKWMQDSSGNWACGSYTDTYGPTWTYKPVAQNVANFVANNAVVTPTKVDGSTSKWMGCIEEASTTSGQTNFDSNNLPNDLNPDLIPNTDDKRWKPLWPDVEYLRNPGTPYPTSNSDGKFAGTNSYPYNFLDSNNRLKPGYMVCGKPVKRLGEMTKSDVSNFVNAADFKAQGGTYHDVGMIWGLRLLSSRGIFSSDTAAWPGRPAPKRVLIFLTDGMMSPSSTSYSVYGVENLDQRVANGNEDDLATYTDYHNKRFAALCDKAQTMNIDVWTVAIAAADIQTLKDCASAPAQGTHTTSGQGLSDFFKSIAERVAKLRITQ